MTEQEVAAIKLSGQLATALGDLPVEHPCDLEEHVRDIHNIQNRIMARATARGTRNLFPKYED